MHLQTLVGKNWSRAFSIWIEDVQVQFDPMTECRALTGGVLARIRVVTRMASLLLLPFFCLYCTHTQAAPERHDFQVQVRPQPVEAPLPEARFMEVGKASWYGGQGDGFTGRYTASGEPLNPSDLTCAHRTLPFDTLVEVENQDTGQRAVLRVNDRGPFVKGRVLDVSCRAALELGFMAGGTARIVLREVQERLAPSVPDAVSCLEDVFSRASGLDLRGSLVRRRRSGCTGCKPGLSSPGGSLGKCPMSRSCFPESNPSSAASPELRALLVIPAGGRGLRLGGGVPKQFRIWRGVPLLLATIQAFLKPGMPPIGAVSLAVPPDRVEEVRGWSFGVPVWVTEGGDTRQDSVRRALDAVDLGDATPVLIHDAVRPFPPAEPILEALDSLSTWDAALLAEASTDTLKRVDAEGRVVATVPRDEIFRAQTPQVACLGLWRRAFRWAEETGFSGTDDVSILEAMGLRVRMIPAPSSNIKITTPADWERTEGA